MWSYDLRNNNILECPTLFLCVGSNVLWEKFWPKLELFLDPCLCCGILFALYLTPSWLEILDFIRNSQPCLLLDWLPMHIDIPSTSNAKGNINFSWEYQALIFKKRGYFEHMVGRFFKIAYFKGVNCFSLECTLC